MPRLTLGNTAWRRCLFYLFLHVFHSSSHSWCLPSANPDHLLSVCLGRCLCTQQYLSHPPSTYIYRASEETMVQKIKKNSFFAGLYRKPGQVDCSFLNLVWSSKIRVGWTIWSSSSKVYDAIILNKSLNLHNEEIAPKKYINSQRKRPKERD